MWVCRFHVTFPQLNKLLYLLQKYRICLRSSMVHISKFLLSCSWLRRQIFTVGNKRNRCLSHHSKHLLIIKTSWELCKMTSGLIVLIHRKRNPTNGAAPICVIYHFDITIQVNSMIMRWGLEVSTPSSNLTKNDFHERLFYYGQVLDFIQCFVSKHFSHGIM